MRERGTVAKRALDLVGGVLGGLVLLPVMLVAAGLVALRLGRPVLFRQDRIGRGGRTFRLAKFRTMTDARDADGVLLPDEARRTRLGTTLRALSIDELPTLWHIVRGDMSLVGPRPLLPAYVDRYTPRQARRHEVRPGLTGWAQINGRNDVAWAEKLEQDVWYVEHRSFLLDLWIILRTVAVVLGRRGVNREGHATAPEFTGTPDAVPTTADGLRRAPTVLHVTTVDLSLAALLLPQLVGQREAGWHVVGASAPGPWVGRIEREGIPHLPLVHSTRRWRLRSDLMAAAELYRSVRRLRPDVLHTHNPKPGLYGRVIGRLARVPVVVNTVHGLYATPDDPVLRRVVVLALERIAATCSDAELLQNEEDLAPLRRAGVPARRLHILGNGIDLSVFDPDRWPRDARDRLRDDWGVARDAVLVGFIGRFVAEKGLPELLDAWARLRQGGTPVALALIGDDDPARPDAIDREVLADAVRAGAVVVGWQDPVAPVYRALDVLALPSHREGFPRTPMEAAAMGVPVVATDVRGCRQAVRHGVTGLLVPPRDPAALAAALERLARSPDLRDRYGRAGREDARQRFDVRRQTRLTLDVYAAALERRAPRGEGPV